MLEGIILIFVAEFMYAFAGQLIVFIVQFAVFACLWLMIGWLNRNKQENFLIIVKCMLVNIAKKIFLTPFCGMSLLLSDSLLNNVPQTLSADYFSLLQYVRIFFSHFFNCGLIWIFLFFPSALLYYVAKMETKKCSRLLKYEVIISSVMGGFLINMLLT